MAKDVRPSIEDIIKDVAKRFEVEVGSLSSVLTPTQGLTTGNLAIDYLTGIGGLPVGRVTELYGQPSSGKAQPLDSLVLTPGGYIKMGEVEVGTLVSTPDGLMSSVVGVYPQGVKPVYRLAFSDGSSCEATDEHLWTVEVYVPYFGFIPATVTTAQLRERMRAQRPRVRLPQVAPLLLGSLVADGTDVPLHPYLLGLLLGDGGMTGASVLFTTKDPELLDAVRRLAPDDCEVVPQTKRVSGISWRINGIQSYLRGLGLLGMSSATKFVPEVYKHQPAGSRLMLLQGLMDTDGHASSGTYNAGHGTAEFTSASQQLRDDVLWLARSLGLKAIVGKTKKTSYVNQAGERIACKDAYRVRIYQTEKVRIFALARKLKPIAPGLHTNRELISIEYLRDAECQCIAISGRDQLYITDDFIPTHNTTTALQCAAALQRRLIAEGSTDHILYMDYEHALDADYAAGLGLNVEHPTFLSAQPHWLEQGAEAARKFIESGRVRLVIWDSVAEMTPKSVLDADFDRRTGAMERARQIKELLARLTPLIHQHNCAAVFLNHAVEAVDMGGGRPGMPPVETTPGGKALKFYASLRMSYKQIGQKKAKVLDRLTGELVDQVAAVDTRVKVTKNKLNDPFREAIVRVRFGSGFDNVWSALEVLTAYRKVVIGAGGYRYFDAKNVPELVHDDMARSATGRPSIQGEAAVLRFADEHPEWRDRLIATAVDLVNAKQDTVLPGASHERIDPFADDTAEADA